MRDVNTLSSVPAIYIAGIFPKYKKRPYAAFVYVLIVLTGVLDSALDFPTAQTSGADQYPAGSTINDSLNPLQVRCPGALGPDM